MLVLYGLACGAAGIPFSALAGVTTNVSVVDFTYVPDTVTINAGDTVNWVWNGAFHSSTSDTTPNPLWDSQVHSTPFSFSYAFTNSGVYTYHCTVHVATHNMRGSVSVLAADLPPDVAVTNPPNGAVLSAPAAFALAASASDSDGSVTNVQFLQGTTSLANVTSSPYSVTVSNLAAGDYTLSAVATDNAGLKATNAILIHVVTPVPILLSAPQRLSASAFQFNYSANTGLSYVVFRSAALPGLMPLSTNTATTNPVTFIDNSATGGMNFYGVHLAPNP